MYSKSSPLYQCVSRINDLVSQRAYSSQSTVPSISIIFRYTPLLTHRQAIVMCVEVYATYICGHTVPLWVPCRSFALQSCPRYQRQHRNRPLRCSCTCQAPPSIDEIIQNTPPADLLAGSLSNQTNQIYQQYNPGGALQQTRSGLRPLLDPYQTSPSPSHTQPSPQRSPNQNPSQNPSQSQSQSRSQSQIQNQSSSPRSQSLKPAHDDKPADRK